MALLVRLVTFITYLAANFNSNYAATITPSWYLNVTSSTADTNQVTNIPIFSTYNINASISPSASNKIPYSSSIVIASDPCVLYKKWSPDFYTDSKLCITDTCLVKFLNEIIKYMECNSWASADEMQLIASRVSQYLLLKAEKNLALIGNEPLTKVKNYLTEKKKYFQVEYGFIMRSFQDFHQALEFAFDFGEVKINYAPTQLSAEKTVYQFSEFNDIYLLDRDIKLVYQQTAIEEALDKLPKTFFKADKKYYNSRIVSFSTQPPVAISSDYISITFKLKNYKNLTLTNHLCIHMQNLGSGFWSDGQCHEYFSDEDKIICKCEALSGSYAVISELEKEVEKATGIERTSMTSLLIGVSIFGIVGMVACLLLPHMTDTSHLGGILKLYFLSDVTMGLEFGVLLYGVMNSDNLERTPFIGAALHYLHTSVMMWVLAEGFFLYHGILPLFQDTTGISFFFGTVAFGLSASIAGGSVGYTFGYTDQKQFIWPTASGSDAVYLLSPALVALVVLAIFDVVLIYELLSWIGNKEDYSYARSVTFLKRANGYMFVLIVTNYMGISSQQEIEDKFYSYLFVAFLVIQIICQMYYHFFSNFEVWGYKAEQEEFSKLKETTDEDNLIENEEMNESAGELRKKNIDDLLFTPPPVRKDTIKETKPATEAEINYEEDGVDGRDSPPSTTDSQVPLIESRSESVNSNNTTANDVFDSKTSLSEKPDAAIIDIPESNEEEKDDKNIETDEQTENNTELPTDNKTETPVNTSKTDIKTEANLEKNDETQLKAESALDVNDKTETQTE